MHHTVTKHRGIITLYRHQKAAFAITSRRGPTPKATKTQIGDLPTSSGGNMITELDEVSANFKFSVFLNAFQSILLYVPITDGFGEKKQMLLFKAIILYQHFNGDKRDLAQET